jgi:hypothetical protein
MIQEKIDTVNQALDDFVNGHYVKRFKNKEENGHDDEEDEEEDEEDEEEDDDDDEDNEDGNTEDHDSELGGKRKLDSTTD